MSARRIVLLRHTSFAAHTIGSNQMKRLLEYGFEGKIYSENLKGGVIEGIEAYKSILDLSEALDLAIIIVNAKCLLSAIEQCHEKGVKGLCVIQGRCGRSRARKGARAYGMRCVGANCLGVVNMHPDIRMDGCFAESLPERGDIGFVSQSDALAAAFSI